MSSAANAAYSRRADNRAGFTLIELLVVIVIVVILGALLFTQARRASGSAQRTKCIGNLRSVGVAYHAYAADHNGRFPAPPNGEDCFGAYIWDASASRLLSPERGGFGEDAFDYVENTKIFFCPAQKVYGYPSPNPSFPWAREGYYAGYVFMFWQKSFPDFYNTRSSDSPNQPMVFDFGWKSWDEMGEKLGKRSHPEIGNNVLYLGGHVKTVSALKIDAARNAQDLFQAMKD